MKLIMENWRRYLNEASVEPEESKRIEALLKEISPKGDWSVLKMLGRGQHGGKTYLIESGKTIERRALKVVEPEEEYYDRQFPNYKWVANNRDSLPEEIRKHLPKVFSIDRTRSGTDLIQMEVLVEAPKDVVADLIVPVRDKDAGGTTKRKMDVLLSDISTVEDLVSEVASDATYVLNPVVEDPKRRKKIAEVIANKIMEKWQIFYDSSKEAVFPGQKRPKFFDPSPKWEDPLRKLKSIVELELSTQLGTILNSFNMGLLAKSLTKNAVKAALYSLDDVIKRAPVPLTVDPVAARKSSATPYTPKQSALFPEAKSLLNAMNTLKDEYGFVALDVHSDNVMARPKSGDLVIVDLGLFKRKNKKPKAGEAE